MFSSPEISSRNISPTSADFSKALRFSMLSRESEQLSSFFTMGIKVSLSTCVIGRVLQGTDIQSVDFIRLFSL